MAKYYIFKQIRSLLSPPLLSYLIDPVDVCGIAIPSGIYLARDAANNSPICYILAEMIDHSFTITWVYFALTVFLHPVDDALKGQMLVVSTNKIMGHWGLLQLVN